MAMEGINTRARTTAVIWTGCLELVARLRTLVVGVKNTFSDGSYVVVSDGCFGGNINQTYREGP